MSVPLPSALTDGELHYERAKRHLAMQRMPEWAPAMDELQKELDILDAEHNRRFSIFASGRFKGGV